MTALQLLGKLRRSKIQVWVEGDRLRYRAPEDSLTPDLLEELTQHKREVLDFLLRVEDGERPAPRLAVAPRDGDPPLSFGQEGLWFLHRAHPEGSSYHIPLAFRLRGHLDPEAIAVAFALVEQRHEVLRTTFVETPSGVVQRIARPGRRPPLLRGDLTALPAPAQEREALRVAHRHATRPFALEREPGLRATLLALAQDDHLLLVNLHHAVCDDWSINLLMSELGAGYVAAWSDDSIGNGTDPLPPLTLQYGDFAIWQRQRLTDDVLDRLLEYWHRRLDGAPAALDLPTDLPRPAWTERRGAHLRFQLGGSEVAPLEALARERKASLFMGLLAVFADLLRRLAGQDDVILGVPGADRGHPELESLIGYFVNALVLRVDLSGNPTVGEALDRVRDAVLEARAHQELPFDRLVQALAPDRDPNRHPLFQVMFSFTREEGWNVDLPGIQVESLAVDPPSAAFDLDLQIWERPERVEGRLGFCTELWEEDTVRRWLGYYRRLLEAWGRDPGRRVSGLSVLDAAERRQLLEQWGAGPVRDRPAPSFLRAFEARVATRRDVVAVEAGGWNLTYQELEERSNRLARLLRGRGVEPEHRVGICLDSSPDRIVALLAVMKAGAAYVPLDSAYPLERLRLMVEDSGTRLVVTQAGAWRSLGTASCVPLLLDAEALAGQDGGPLRSDPDPRQAAYVIYTSGSTGRPKGVVISHGALANFVEAARGFLELVQSDRVLQFASISFDSSVEELYPALSAGATLILREDEMASSATSLFRAVGERRITLLPLPTALWHQVIPDVASGRVDLPAHLRLVRVAGEKALADRFAAWQAATSIPLLNAYGPTEATVAATAALLRRPVEGAPEVPADPPIGRPILGCRTLVLDRELEPVPFGADGELCVGGLGVARGYLGQPALTATKFAPDPHDGPGGRLYRTGDRACWGADGVLSYHGRLDHQVKVRGFRVEPGEIEAAIGMHRSVESAVVTVDRSVASDPRLVAYVVSYREAPSHEELRAWVAERLPPFLVPAAFVELDELPKLPNGKLDRRRLPAVRWEELARKASEPPEGEIEELVAELWSGLLGIEELGAEDDFFALGGHSLLATRLVSGILERCGVEISLPELFERPTVRGLGALVERRRAEESPVVPELSSGERDGEIPLSYQQQRLWFLARLEPESPAYNLFTGVRLRGELRLEVLARAISDLAGRHETLRTAFREVGGRPLQEVSAEGRVPLREVDLTGLSPGVRDLELRRNVRAFAGQPFDLGRGPLLRLAVVTLGDRDRALLLSLHHIVGDGWSMGLLVREATLLYAAHASGSAPELDPLPIQYADYARWQRSWVTDDVLKAQLSYWRRQLSGAPALLTLPTDRPRPAHQSYRGRLLNRRLGSRIRQSLDETCRRRGATPFMLLLAAFQVLLARYSGQSDVCVGTPVAGRERPQVAGLIGFFVNTLVLRLDLSGDQTFTEVLHRARERVIEAQRHQEIPFDRLVEELAPDRSLSHTPLFQVMLAQNLEREEPEPLQNLAMEPLGADNGTAKFDLTLFTSLAETEIGLDLEIATDLFDVVTGERFLAHFESLLSQALADPASTLAALDLLSPAERHQMLREWNDCDRARPARTVSELVAEQAERTPDAVAVAAREGQWTYAELDRRARSLATSLRHRGIGRECPVAVLVERGLDVLAILLAIFRSGGTFLPLEASEPIDRHARVLAVAKAPLLVAAEGLFDRAVRTASAASGSTGVATLQELAATGPECGIPPAGGGDAGGLAYVLFTSGSTGVPKGAMVEHRGMVNHLLAKIEDLGLTRADRLAQTARLSFDISLWQLVAPLLVGGRVVILEDEIAQEPRRLLNAVDREGITVLETVPSLLQVLVEESVVREGGLSGLRWMVPTGETLPPELARRWLDAFPAVPLVNAYGPTECSDDVSHHTLRRFPSAGVASVAIGRPLANLRLHIADATVRPQPLGVVGELLISGIGVGRGYLDEPSRTAAAFVPDPFGTAAGARVYRTGDLGRFRRSGELEYLGRRDHQVKVRGFRIELGEIEAALRSEPEVRDGVVVAAEWGAVAGVRLAAYTVFEPGRQVEETDLRRRLLRSLPDYMVPSAFVVLESLPLTPNGKVDRQALPAPEGGESVTGSGPRGATEEVLASVWEELLGLEDVDRGLDFFAVGGHSLLATQLVSRLREVFGVELGLREVFEAPVLGDLARRVERALGAGGGSAPAIERVSREGPLSISFAQQRLWFLGQLEPGSSAYHVPLALRLRGPLDAAALGWALGEETRRQEGLRTRFAWGDGGPVQRIGAPSGVALPVVDLSALGEERREEELAARLGEQARRPFDLSAGPPWRGVLVRLGAEEHVLALTLHHIITDGWSMEVLMREVGALYAARRSGGQAELPGLRVQYADYAAWQRTWLSGEVLDEQLGYWRERLAGVAPLLELPTDRPRPAVETFRGGSESVVLDGELVKGLARWARGEGATLQMALLAGFQALLGRYAGQRNVVVGVPVAGRTRLEVEDLVGFFVNTLAIRTDLSGGADFRELVARVRESSLGAYARQDVPFEMLVEELSPERSLSHSPLVQVMFALQNVPRRKLPGVSELTAEEIGMELEEAKFDLTLALGEAEDEMAGELSYKADLFDATTIRRLLGHLERLLAGALANPECPVAALDLLDEAERFQLVVEWNAGEERSEDGEVKVHELFRTQAARRPEAIALTDGVTTLSYGELAARAGAWARSLRRQGVGPEEPVGVCMGRSVDLVVALLAVLESGGCYLPLDPKYPAERLTFMVGDSGARWVLSEERIRPLVEAAHVRALCLDSETERATAAAAADDRLPPAPGRLAYVIYTSGSTGRPKGVEIEHPNILALVRWARRTYSAAALDWVLASSSVCFDLSVFEILAPLAWGGTVILAEDALALGDHPERERVMLINTVPSAAAELTRSAWLPESVRVANLAGEALPGELVRGLYSQGVAEVWNLYGPSEDTTYSTAERIAREPGAWPPIGRPLPGTRAQVLDERLGLVPPAVVGELHLAGSGLSRGYRGRPALTAEQFVPDPYSQAGARLYRTGDFVRHLPDGRLEFLGRRDHQVKVRGFRIELGDIEAALRAEPEVREAVVVAAEWGEGMGERLAAYLVFEPHRELDEAEMRHRLRRSLPDYMVPSVFVALASLPLTPNGKVDRRALPAPQGGEEAVIYQAPQTMVERLVAGIWRQLLGVDRVGLHDDFFALRGHSLVATQVVMRVNQTFDVELPLIDLFESPTVAGLAAKVQARLGGDGAGNGVAEVPLLFGLHRLWFMDHLEPSSAAYRVGVAIHGDEDVSPLATHEVLRTALHNRLATPDRPRTDALVALRRGGDAAAVFCVHPAGGGIGDYVALARHLQPPRPFYALRDPWSEASAPSSLEGMAARYLAEVRSVQPHGPYRLVGWSFGGAVAFEMAGQLAAAGEPVPALVLLDSRMEALSQLPRLEPLELVVLFGRQLGLAKRQVKLSEEERQEIRGVDDGLDRLYALVLSEKLLPVNTSRATFLQLFETFQRHAELLAGYRPAPYVGPVTVVLASTPSPASDDGGWGRCADVRSHRIEGDHYSILREPAVAELGRLLGRILLGSDASELELERAVAPPAAVATSQGDPP